jgi:hypothetical protein
MRPLKRFTPQDQERFAIYAILAHETARHAGAIPPMLIEGRIKQLLSRVIAADHSLLGELEKNIKGNIASEVRRSGLVPADQINQIATQTWYDEYNFIEDCSQVLGEVVGKLLKTGRVGKSELLTLLRDWAEGRLVQVEE